MESDIARNELLLQTLMIQKQVLMGALLNSWSIKCCQDNISGRTLLEKFIKKALQYMCFFGNLTKVFKSAINEWQLTKIPYLKALVRRQCAYQGVRNVCFPENLACFVFLKHPFWDSPFCFITDALWQSINFRTSAYFLYG